MKSICSDHMCITSTVVISISFVPGSCDVPNNCSRNRYP